MHTESRHLLLTSRNFKSEFMLFKLRIVHFDLIKIVENIILVEIIQM